MPASQAGLTQGVGCWRWFFSDFRFRRLAGAGATAVPLAPCSRIARQSGCSGRRTHTCWCVLPGRQPFPRASPSRRGTTSWSGTWHSIRTPQTTVNPRN